MFCGWMIVGSPRASDSRINLRNFFDVICWKYIFHVTRFDRKQNYYFVLTFGLLLSVVFCVLFLAACLEIFLQKVQLWFHFVKYWQAQKR